MTAIKSAVICTLRLCSDSCPQTHAQFQLTRLFAGRLTQRIGSPGILAAMARGGGYLALGGSVGLVASAAEAKDEKKTPIEPKAVAAAIPAPKSTGDEEVNDLREGSARYIAYIGRAGRTLALQGSRYVRYVAYSSDVGESLRPIVNPKYVTALYGVTWLYVGYDVCSSGYRSYKHKDSNEIVARTMIHAFTFQSIASVAIPSLIIHQAVHVAQKMLAKTAMSPRIQVYTAVAVGLGLIPAMPYIDEPAEHAIEAAFDYVWPVEGGSHAHSD